MGERALPADVSLRPATDADLPFLRRLYASTREEELAPVPWTAEQKQAFLAQQFEAQHRFYHEQFAHARFDVIECSGEAAGRLYVDRCEGELRVLDIALLPGQRGRGIGSALLAGLLEEAGAAGHRVTLHVEPANPALRLYARLGFVHRRDEGPYRFLEWAPPAQAKTAS